MKRHSGVAPVDASENPSPAVKPVPAASVALRTCHAASGSPERSSGPPAKASASPRSRAPSGSALRCQSSSLPRTKETPDRSEGPGSQPAMPDERHPWLQAPRTPRKAGAISHGQCKGCLQSRHLEREQFIALRQYLKIICRALKDHPKIAIPKASPRIDRYSPC